MVSCVTFSAHSSEKRTRSGLQGHQDNGGTEVATMNGNRRTAEVAKHEWQQEASGGGRVGA